MSRSIGACVQLEPFCPELTRGRASRVLILNPDSNMRPRLKVSRRHNPDLFEEIVRGEGILGDPYCLGPGILMDTSSAMREKRQ